MLIQEKGREREVGCRVPSEDEDEQGQGQGEGDDG